MLGTNVSRRVISPDCDSHGDRVTVVVRGREQLAGLQLQVRQDRQPRPHGAAAQACAGARDQLAAVCRQALHDGAGRAATHLRVIARDVAGNTRAIDARRRSLARGVALTLPDRAIVAGKRLRVGISADARSLRLDLARLGGATTAVLARGAHAPSGDRAHPGRAARRHLRRRQPARRAHASRRCWRCAARRRRASRSSWRPRPTASLIAAVSSASSTRSASASTSLTQRDIARGALPGYAVVVAPPAAGAPRATAVAGHASCTSPRRHRPRARLVIPAAFALVAAAGLAGVFTRADRPARLASLLLTAGGTLALLGWVGVAHTLRAHAAVGGGRPRSLRSQSALAAAVVLRRRPLAAPVRGLHRRAVPLPRAHRQPGREPARAALRGHRRRLPRAADRRAARQRSPCVCPRAGSRCPCCCCVAWEGASLSLERERDARARRRSGSTRCPFGVLLAALVAHPPPRAAPRRPAARAGRARARLRGRRRLPGAPPRRLVEPQADGVERVQLVLPRELDLLRPLDLRALPGGHDRDGLRGAAVRRGCGGRCSRPRPRRWRGSGS